LGLFIGAIVSSIAIGFTIKILDTPTADQVKNGIHHAIGSSFSAPQATLMATLIKGILGGKLDWNFVIAGAALAIVMELCGVKALSFAIGVYLPLSTTLPIFIGGGIKGIVQKIKLRRDEAPAKEGEEDLESGNLFATGLVAGGALLGVLFALLSRIPAVATGMENLSVETGLRKILGEGGYMMLGVICFVIMGLVLYRVGVSRRKNLIQ
jgi:uncharacterized oligopeptide transporter (OPT) family protein